MNRTLIIMPELFWGGAEKQFRYLISELKEDIIVCISHSYSRESDYGDIERQYIAENNKTLFFQVQVLEKSGKLKRIIKLCHLITKAIKKYHPSSVIVYDSFGVNLIPYLKLHKLFVIYSERNSGEGLIQNKRWLSFIKMVDCISTNSSYAAKTLETKANLKVNLIKNGIIDRHNFKPHLGKANIFLIPARISRVKNQLLALKMLFLDNSSEKRVKFAGVSEDENYIEELTNYVNDNHLSEKVDFLGYCDNSEKLYKNIDAVILPSLEEGTSNVILECFLRGIPIFVSSIEMNTFTKNLRTFSFDPNDERQLLGVIESWNQLSDEDKIRILNENYQYVVSEHSVSKMVDSYVNLLRQGEK